MKSILDQIVNYFPMAQARKGSEAYYGKLRSLREILTTQHDEHVNKIEFLRSISDPEARKTYKQSNLPCYHVSCFCGSDGVGSRLLENLQYHTNLIALDLDKIGNNLENIKAEICTLPQVAFCAKSCSGNGLFALFRINEPIRHYEYFEKVFPELCQAMGIQVHFDSAVKNINRLRFVTSDLGYYVNDNPTHIRLPASKKHYFISPYKANETANDFTLGRLKNCVEYLQLNQIDIVDSYSDWIKIGFALAELGEKGRLFFHQISAINYKYNHSECDLKFSKILQKYNGATTLGTFFRICQLAFFPYPNGP